MPLPLPDQWGPVVKHTYICKHNGKSGTASERLQDFITMGVADNSQISYLGKRDFVFAFISLIIKEEMNTRNARAAMV